MVQLVRISNKFIRGYRSSTKRNIPVDWDYKGDWKKQENGDLSITNSNLGGILRKMDFGRIIQIKLMPKSLYLLQRNTSSRLCRSNFFGNFE